MYQDEFLCRTANVIEEVANEVPRAARDELVDCQRAAEEVPSAGVGEEWECGALLRVSVLDVWLRRGEEVDVEWVGMVVARMAEEGVEGKRPVGVGVEVPGVDGNSRGLRLGPV